jgi:hypothetical protein
MELQPAPIRTWDIPRLPPPADDDEAACPDCGELVDDCTCPDDYPYQGEQDHDD